jgi:hypothetical protein
MKKYLFGLLAITIAIGAVAFTNPKRATKTFRYKLSTYAQNDVQSKANWEFVSSQSCNNLGTLDAACKIVVDEAYFHETTPGVFELNTSGSQITIVAVQGGETGKYMVDATNSVNISSVTNKILP